MTRLIKYIIVTFLILFFGYCINFIVHSQEIVLNWFDFFAAAFITVRIYIAATSDIDNFIKWYNKNFIRAKKIKVAFNKFCYEKREGCKFTALFESLLTDIKDIDFKKVRINGIIEEDSFNISFVLFNDNILSVNACNETIDNKMIDINIFDGKKLLYTEVIDIRLLSVYLNKLL